MLKVEDLAFIDSVLANYPKVGSSVIAVMQEVQKKYRYLPQDALSYIAKSLNVSEAKIYGIATFYENFSLEEKGKYVIKICDGTACHVRKSIPILNAIRTELGLSDKKHTTDDMLFTVETVSCLGACGLSPVMTVNNKVYAAMTPAKAREVLDTLREEHSNENN